MLLQGQIWVTRDADIRLLADLSVEHLRNIRAMLQARAVELHLAAILDAIEGELDAMSSGMVTGEALSFALTGQSLASLTAEQWLDTLPLLRAIDRHLANH